MIDWTYSSFRVFMRLLAPQSLVYTEMQTTGAVLNNSQRALLFNPSEHPIALQLGGADPKALANCALLAEQMGYDEINLNLGCPSDKVQAGQFGACLMNEPELVAQCIRALKAAVDIPITAKTRIGIDGQDSYAFFRDFVEHLLWAGCNKIIIHARKAWLQGLSPKQNRTIPPLHYEYAYQIKQDYPEIAVVINGNITTLAEIQEHLRQVDGVMLGRLACDNPYQIATIHQGLYPRHPLLNRSQILIAYLSYCDEQCRAGLPLSVLLKPLFTLAHGLSGARSWKQSLMQVLRTKDTGLFSELIKLMQRVEHQRTSCDL